MHFVALAGTTAMVMGGYCPLARMLAMLLLNRTEPLTLSFARRIWLSPPEGGLFYRKPAAAIAGPSCSCSLQELSPRDL
jgi:hypothetical protein